MQAGALETGLVQQVDRRRSAATERNHMIETLLGAYGCERCPADTATAPKTTATPGCGNDVQGQPRDEFRCPVSRDRLPRRAPDAAGPFHRRREMRGRTGRNARWPGLEDRQGARQRGGARRPAPPGQATPDLDESRARQIQRARRLREHGTGAIACRRAIPSGVGASAAETSTKPSASA